MISFEDILKAPSERKYKSTIEGLGEVELTELSGTEALERLKQAREIEKLGNDGTEKFQEHTYFWAARLMKGKKPSGPELKKFSNNLSPSLAFAIYSAAVGSSSNREELEKN